MKVSFVVLLLAVVTMGAGKQPPDPAAPAIWSYGDEESPPSGSYLGVDVQDVTAERVAALKLKEERGVEITMVDQDAPAGKIGLKPHDIILEFNGAKVEGTEQLRRMIHETPPGRTVTLGISRDGKPLQLAVQLGDKRQALAFKKKDYKLVMPPMPPMPQVVIPSIDVTVRSYSRAGLVVDNLTPQLGEFFGAKNGEGVLVRSVEKGSPADAAGFKAGDVIIRVANERVTDKGDWRNTLRSHRSGKINITIIRDKKEQTLSLALPEAKDDRSWLNFQVPDVHVDLEEMRTALNGMRPEIERAMAAARAEMERAGAEMQKAGEEMRKALEEATRDLEIEVEDH